MVDAEDVKRLSPRELRRMQDRMLSSLGISMEEMGTAKQVVIELQNRTIKIEGATVVAINSQTGKIYQIVGGEETEAATVEEPVKPSYEPSPEDIALVASQAGVDQEDAKAALVETEGDLARAILSLKAKRS